jgi:vacuolar-type H+-ATPase subunit F/Vma7
MKLTLPTGTELNVQRLDDVLNSGAPGIAADALVVSADALRAPEALERLARKLKEDQCTLVAILGREAERVHDTLDELLIGDGATEEPLPTTTWHSADEAAEDILNMVEQLVRSSASGHGAPTILVIHAHGSVPTDVRGLVRQLDADLRGESSG